MALDSTSTLADALAQYNDNLSWDGDITKAIAALAAVRWLLINRPKVIETNDRIVNFELLMTEQAKLEKFVSNFSGSVNRCSFTSGRPVT
jgi:hypothetical protein